MLATAISNAAGDAGVTFADVRTPFVGHAVCDRSPWILNASLFKSYESFHPNATGHSSGYRPVVATALGPIASTGTTAKVIRKLLPKAHFATVYAKPGGKPQVDTFITEVSQDTWILFPWDTEPQFIAPIAKSKGNGG